MTPDGKHTREDIANMKEAFILAAHAAEAIGMNPRMPMYCARQGRKWLNKFDIFLTGEKCGKALIDREAFLREYPPERAVTA